MSTRREFVSFRAQNPQPARRHDGLVRFAPFRLQRLDARHFVGFGQILVGGDDGFLRVDVAAQNDVGAAPGHVGGDGHRARRAGLGDNRRLARVLFGVQNLVGDILRGEQRRQFFGSVDRRRADERRLPARARRFDVLDNRARFAGGGAIDAIQLVVANHLAMSRNLQNFQVVNESKLLGLGRGGAGHAGDFAIQAEVVLKRSRGEGLVFALDCDSFFGFDRLMLAFAQPPPGHQAAGEFVDQNGLSVLDDIIAVAQIQMARFQRRREMVQKPQIGGVVKRFAAHHFFTREHALGFFVAGFGQMRLARFFVDDEIAARRFALADLAGARERRIQIRRGAVGFFEAGRDDGDGAIHLDRIGRLARNNKRHPRLVDEDRIDLVDNREIQARLQAVVGPEAHIVAQIIEAELIVGAVDDGTSVSRALVDRTRRRQIDSDIEPQKSIHRAHPFGVAAGEIIVDRHNVRFAAQGLQTGGQSRHQGFAFSRFHFGDAP